MKKIIVLVAAVFCCVLIGCMTVPPPSAENRCMLLINREFTKTSRFEPYITYHMYIDNQIEPHTSFKASSYFLCVDNLEPGKHTINFIVAEMNTGESSWTVPNSVINFGLEEGRVTVLDLTFNITVEPMPEKTKGGEYWYQQYMIITTLTDEQHEELIEDFKSKDPDGLWDI